MKTRSYMNRLEKYFSDNGEHSMSQFNNIWEIESVLEAYESSSDEEEIINNDLNTETPEEEPPLELSESDQFVYLVTGSHGSFKQGKQIHIPYGRLNNSDLLLDYGFALLPNRYDSVLLRV